MPEAAVAGGLWRWNSRAEGAAGRGGGSLRPVEAVVAVRDGGRCWMTQGCHGSSAAWQVARRRVCRRAGNVRGRQQGAVRVSGRQPLVARHTCACAAAACLYASFVARDMCQAACSSVGSLCLSPRRTSAPPSSNGETHLSARRERFCAAAWHPNPGSPNLARTHSCLTCCQRALFCVRCYTCWCGCCKGES